MCAATAKLAEPTQRVLRRRRTAERESKSRCAGGAMVAATVVLWLVSIVPARAKRSVRDRVRDGIQRRTDASRSESPMSHVVVDTDPESHRSRPRTRRTPQLSVAAVPRTIKRMREKDVCARAAQ